MAFQMIPCSRYASSQHPMPYSAAATISPRVDDWRAASPYLSRGKRSQCPSRIMPVLFLSFSSPHKAKSTSRPCSVIPPKVKCRDLIPPSPQPCVSQDVQYMLLTLYSSYIPSTPWASEAFPGKCTARSPFLRSPFLPFLDSAVNAESRVRGWRSRALQTSRSSSRTINIP